MNKTRKKPVQSAMPEWQQISTVPMDGSPILVCLAEEIYHGRIHAASYLPNIVIVGSHFEFDMPTATHWMRQPDVADPGWLPISTVPMDGTPVLVLLQDEVHASRIHSAAYLPNIQFVGANFALDMPPVTHWMPLPKLPELA